MVETFYQTEVTAEKYTQLAAYYTLALIHLTGSFFSVTEHHGWWDNVDNRARLKTTILTDAGEPSTEVAARRIYDEQRTYLMSQGFIHAYQQDVMNGEQAHTIPVTAKEKRGPYDAL